MGGERGPWFLDNFFVGDKREEAEATKKKNYGEAQDLG